MEENNTNNEASNTDVSKTNNSGADEANKTSAESGGAKVSAATNSGGSNKKGAPIAAILIAVICLLGVCVFAWQYLGNAPLIGEQTERAYPEFWDVLLGEVNSLDGSFELSAVFNQTPPDDLEQLANTIANSKITGNFKVSASEDQKKSKLAMNLIVNYSGMTIPADIWCDVDVSDAANPKVLYIFKCEPLAAFSMGMIPANKYLYLDYADLPEADEAMRSVTPMIENSKKIRDDILAAFDKKKFKLTKNDDKYTAILGEQSLKELCRDVLMAAINSTYETAILDTRDEEEKTSLTTQKDEAINQINEVFNQIKDMKIFAENALVIDVTLASDKTAKTEDVTINVNPDLKSIARASGEPENSVPDYNLDLSVFFKTTYNSVNKPVDVNIPALNETNSVDLIGMINSMYGAAPTFDEYEYDDGLEPSMSWIEEM